MTEQDVNWISVGELAESFAPNSNKLAMTGNLSGKILSLAFEGGESASYEFLSSETLRWTEGAVTEDADYFATTIRPGLYFIDYVKTGVSSGASVSIVVDFDANVATVILAQLPGREVAHGSILARAQQRKELTLVETVFRHASIGARFEAEAAHHGQTSDLIGLRIRHTYNPNELYEHIYLNDKKYCWHCIQGSESGLGDVDLCYYYSVRPSLYLFVWCEKVVPTVGIVLIDLDALKTTGKIFGYQDNGLTKAVSFPIGAYSEIANRTPSGSPKIPAAK
jgi:hypothetical protein